MIKEMPILFSTDMVRAILAGRKTVTRRIVKPQPEDGLHNHTKYPMSLDSDMQGWWGVDDATGGSRQYNCKYGEPGDILWVRETFRSYYNVDENGFTDFDKEIIEYAADRPEPKVLMDGDGFTMYNKDGTEKYVPYKPSIHMPKEAARIWLRVKDVRVERLQDITEQDAIAEGIEIEHDDGPLGDSLYKSYTGGLPVKTAKESFCTLWWLINGRDSWISNPWVWVVSFEVLSTTGKPELLNSK